MPITSVRLQPELEKPLAEIAENLNRSKNWVINQAIKEYLEKNSLERQRWQETLQALDSARQGKVIDADLVNDWLKSWGTADELPPPKP
jgi:predicted transcriptional regulator